MSRVKRPLFLSDCDNIGRVERLSNTFHDSPCSWWTVLSRQLETTRKELVVEEYEVFRQCGPGLTYTPHQNSVKRTGTLDLQKGLIFGVSLTPKLFKSADFSNAHSLLSSTY